MAENNSTTAETVANNVWVTLTARFSVIAASLFSIILLPQYIAALNMLALHDKQIALLQIEVAAADTQLLDIARRQQEIFSIQNSRVPVLDRLTVDVADHEKRIQSMERGTGPR